jgi:hypothetical protein
VVLEHGSPIILHLASYRPSGTFYLQNSAVAINVPHGFQPPPVHSGIYFLRSSRRQSMRTLAICPNSFILPLQSAKDCMLIAILALVLTRVKPNSHNLRSESIDFAPETCP